MASCPECGAFVWDNQTVCNSCGTDIITGEKRPRSEQERPEPLPVPKRTPIGQRRPKPGDSSLSSGSRGRTPVGQRRGISGESDSSSGPKPVEDTPIRRTRIGQRKSMDGGIAAGFSRRSFSQASTLGEIFSEALTTMFKNPLILVPSIIPMIWSVTAAISGVINITNLIGIGDEDEQWDTIATEFALWTVLSLLIAFWSYAATIRMFAMATEKNGFMLLIDGIVTALERTFTLLISGLIFAIIIVIGSVVFVIPGIIAFILLFLFVQAIMVDNEGATSSLSKSMEVVRANLGGAIIIFLAILIIPTIAEVQAAFADDLPEWAESWGNFLIAGVSLIIQVYIIGLATVFYRSRR